MNRKDVAAVKTTEGQVGVMGKCSPGRDVSVSGLRGEK